LYFFPLAAIPTGGTEEIPLHGMGRIGAGEELDLLLLGKGQDAGQLQDTDQ